MAEIADMPVAVLHHVVFLTVHRHHGDGIAISVGIGRKHLLHSHAESDVILFHVLNALVDGSLVVVVERLHDMQETSSRVGVYRDEGETGFKAERPPTMSRIPAKKSFTKLAPIMVSPVTTPLYSRMVWPSIVGVVDSIIM